MNLLETLQFPAGVRMQTGRAYAVPPSNVQLDACSNPYVEGGIRIVASIVSGHDSKAVAASGQMAPS